MQPTLPPPPKVLVYPAALMSQQNAVQMMNVKGKVNRDVVDKELEGVADVGLEEGVDIGLEGGVDIGLDGGVDVRLEGGVDVQWEGGMAEAEVVVEQVVEGDM